MARSLRPTYFRHGSPTSRLPTPDHLENRHNILAIEPANHRSNVRCSSLSTMSLLACCGQPWEIFCATVSARKVTGKQSVLLRAELRRRLLPELGCSPRHPVGVAGQKGHQDGVPRLPMKGPLVAQRSSTFAKRASNRLQFEKKVPIPPS